jgi:transcriptional enhancer factor
MIQPTRVLPSNAPPLHEIDNSHVSRVLQEHSGNRQQNDYSYSHDSGQKYPAALLTENSYVEQHQPPHQHQPSHVYRQTPLQRHSYRYARNHLGSDDQAKTEKLAKHLYARFTQSEHYMKYRQKQPKGEKGPTDKTWPDRLELAFFQGMLCFDLTRASFHD